MKQDTQHTKRNDRDATQSQKQETVSSTHLLQQRLESFRVSDRLPRRCACGRGATLWCMTPRRRRGEQAPCRHTILSRIVPKGTDRRRAAHERRQAADSKGAALAD